MGGKTTKCVLSPLLTHFKKLLEILQWLRKMPGKWLKATKHILVLRNLERQLSLSRERLHEKFLIVEVPTTGREIWWGFFLKRGNFLFNQKEVTRGLLVLAMRANSYLQDCFLLKFPFPCVKRVTKENVSFQCLRTLVGHTGGVWSSQMRDNIIISGSTDRTLKVWNAETGECIHTLYGHTSTVRCMHLHEKRWGFVQSYSHSLAPCLYTCAHRKCSWNLGTSSSTEWNANQAKHKPRQGRRWLIGAEA